MLSKLSIYCLTYNRHKFIKRLINYWQKNYTECKVYILDGSDQELDKEYVNQINNKKISYIHCKGKSYFERFIKISELIDTKYIQLVADDEIFFRSGAEQCLNFLEQNTDYSSCIGSVLLFDLLDKKEVLAYDVYNLFSNEDHNSYKRVEKWLNFTQPNTIYAIKRSKYFLKIIEELKFFQNKNFSSPENIIEDVTEIGFAFLGKTKKIENLMWMRSLENPSMPFNINKYEEVFPENFLLSNKYLEKKKIFDNFMKNFLDNIKSDINKDNNHILLSCYYNRLKAIRKNHKINLFKKIINMEYIHNFLSKVIPNKIKSYIKYKFYLKKREIMHFLNLNQKNIIFIKNDVEQFRENILRFYDEK